MDPQATYLLCLGALGAGEFDDAREYALNLLEWLDKGGFPPTGMGQQFARAMLAQILATCADVTF